MKEILRKIGKIAWVIFLIAMLIAYSLIAYAILDYFNIGADNS